MGRGYRKWQGRAPCVHADPPWWMHKLEIEVDFAGGAGGIPLSMTTYNTDATPSAEHVEFARLIQIDLAPQVSKEPDPDASKSQRSSKEVRRLHSSDPIDILVRVDARPPRDSPRTAINTSATAHWPQWSF